MSALKETVRIPALTMDFNADEFGQSAPGTVCIGRWKRTVLECQCGHIIGEVPSDPGLHTITCRNCRLSAPIEVYYPEIA
jgi:hypothetical protein